MMTPISRLLRRAFSSSSSPSSRSISRVIYEEPDLQRVVDAFKEFSENNEFRQQTNFYEHTVKRLAKAKRFQWIEDILEGQKDYPDITNEGFVVRIISLYGKAGMFEHARKVFDEMPQLSCNRTFKSFNALLVACVYSRKFDQIDGLLREVPANLAIMPDTVSYNEVITAFCEMGSLRSAILMFGDMVKEGSKPDLFTFNTLFGALYSKKAFRVAENMWDSMEKYNVVPDIKSYNMKLRGLYEIKKVQDLVNLVGEMKSKGLKPDVCTYNHVIRGLCLVDCNFDLEVAKTWYGEMKEAKCTPTPLIYKKLIKFACRKDDFLFASELCRDIIHYKCEMRSVPLLQKVVLGLVKQSYNDEAEALVQHFPSLILKMPEQQQS